MSGQDTIVSRLDDCSGFLSGLGAATLALDSLFSTRQLETVNHVPLLPCSKPSNNFPLLKMKPKVAATASRVPCAWCLDSSAPQSPSSLSLLQPECLGTQPPCYFRAFALAVASANMLLL